MIKPQNLAVAAAPGLNANLSSVRLGPFQRKQLFSWPDTKPVCVWLRESG